MARGDRTTAADIREGYTEAKRLIDRRNHYFGFIIVRPLSFYLAAWAVRCGISATQVTTGGLLVLLVAAGMLVTGDAAMIICGAILVNAWYISDFVDGNLARFNKSASFFGAYFDWWVGHVYHVAVPVAVGIAASRATEAEFLGPLSNSSVYLGGALALLEASRTAMSAKARHAEKGGGESPSPGVRPRKSEQLHLIANGVESFKAPLLLASAAAGVLSLWLLLYACLAGCIWLAVLARSLKAARTADRRARSGI